MTTTADAKDNAGAEDPGEGVDNATKAQDTEGPAEPSSGAPPTEGGQEGDTKDADTVSEGEAPAPAETTAETTKENEVEPKASAGEGDNAADADSANASAPLPAIAPKDASASQPPPAPYPPHYANYYNRYSYSYSQYNAPPGPSGDGSYYECQFCNSMKPSYMDRIELKPCGHFVCSPCWLEFLKTEHQTQSTVHGCKKCFRVIKNNRVHKGQVIQPPLKSSRTTYWQGYYPPPPGHYPPPPQYYPPAAPHQPYYHYPYPYPPPYPPHYPPPQAPAAPGAANVACQQSHCAKG